MKMSWWTELQGTTLKGITIMYEHNVYEQKAKQHYV